MAEALDFGLKFFFWRIQHPFPQHPHCHLTTLLQSFEFHWAILGQNGPILVHSFYQDNCMEHLANRTSFDDVGLATLIHNPRNPLL